jgi:chromosome segregation ATPase
VKTVRTLANILLAGSIIPAGVVLSQAPPNAASNPAIAGEANPASTITNSQNAANSQNVNAQKKFSQIQDLAQQVRKDIAPIKEATTGTQLSWKTHSRHLSTTKTDVNKIQSDVSQLQSEKASLSPWQQQLLVAVKQDSNQMASETTAAMKELSNLRDSTALATTPYYKNLRSISQHATDVTSSIGSVFQSHGIDMD